MTFAPYGNIDLQPMYDYLKVLNVQKTFLFETGKFLYKHNNDETFPTIGGYFEADPYVNLHSYGLRSRSANVPTRLVCHAKSSEKSLQFRGPKLWHSIPSETTNSESLGLFKKNLKAYLLENDHPQ